MAEIDGARVEAAQKRLPYLVDIHDLRRRLPGGT
jgi:hypothetical protein